MTATDGTAAGTAELEQVAPGSLAYVTATNPESKWDLAALAGMLAEQPPAPEAVPVAVPAAKVKITDELRKALRKLPEVFGSVTPTEPRRLEADEVRRITEERTVINKVMGDLGKRDKAIDDAMRCHMDALAGEVNPAAPVMTDGVGKGHRLIATEGEPFAVPVEGYEDAWQQRFVHGKADMSIGLLTDLLLAGKVTRKEFLALTSEIRVLDEKKIKQAVRKDPSRTLSILKTITVRKGDTAQLVPPKK